MVVFVHFERYALFLVEHQGEVALVIVEMRFEGSDGEVFGEVQDGISHSEWERRYA